MDSLNITRKDCNAFPGGWSLDAKQMHLALSEVRYSGTLKILEFGSGQGTRSLVGVLDAKSIPFKYVAYENNKKYACPDVRVDTVIWSKFPVEIKQDVYDLVIVDGPHGLARRQWYPLLKPVVRKGTILVADDWKHFPEFQTALDSNFTYEVLAEHNEKTERNHTITWLLARILAAK